MGKKDGAYNRNTVAVQLSKKLDALQEADRDGYIHQLNEVDSGHWMKGEDAAAVGWMAQYTRNTSPERVVWKQDDVLHDRFYWLAVDEGQAAVGNVVAVSLNGQDITIEKNQGVERLIVRLNDDLVDLDKTVTVRQNGKTLYEGTPVRTIAMIEQSLKQRSDPALVFCSEIVLSPESETGK